MNKKNFAPTPISREELLTEMIKLHTTDKLEEFRRFTHEIESKFNSDQNDLHKSFIKAIEGRPGEEADEISSYFSNEHYRIEEEYLGKHREFTLVAIYSFLEFSLNKLCRHLYEKNQYSKQFDNPRGKGKSIHEAWKYLEEIAQVNTGALNNEWNYINNFNKVRNCIVHCGGNIKSSKDAIELQDIVKITKTYLLRMRTKIT